MIEIFRNSCKKEVKQTESVVISGSGSGMGRSLAVLYSTRKCHLLLIDISQGELEETRRLCMEAGASNITMLVADVRNAESVRRAILDYDALYPIDAVYPCAAVNDIPKSPLPDPVSGFTTLFGINVIGVYNILSPILECMRSRRSGKICLFSSILGFGGSLITPNYTISKNVMRAIAESLHYPLKAFGISISYVSPGGVQTGMTSRLPSWLTCFFLTPEQAAMRILQGTERGEYHILLPFSCYCLCYGFLSTPIYLRQATEALLSVVYKNLFHGYGCRAD